jgi:hypothetical protein
MPTATEFELPATITAVLASRIDRLSDTDKDMLQTAAVVGREFSAAVLSTVATKPDDAVRAALGRLLATEFLVEKPATSNEVYAFKHPLTHEVAYQSQILDRRRRLHAAVAGALRTLHHDRSMSSLACSPSTRRLLGISATLLLRPHRQRSGSACGTRRLPSGTGQGAKLAQTARS